MAEKWSKKAFQGGTSQNFSGCFETKHGRYFPKGKYLSRNFVRIYIIPPKG
jgi:hypothetical protein